MHLTPREVDKLVLHGAGFLAQKRLARGLRLNHPEAIALIATQLLELIRDGRGVAELMDLGRRILGRAQVLDGVPELIAEVQVEGTELVEGVGHGHAAGAGPALVVAVEGEVEEAGVEGDEGECGDCQPECCGL